MNKVKAIIIGGLVLVGILFAFPMLNGIQTSMNSELITPATDNLTPYTAIGGVSVPTFNEAQGFVASYLWWLLALIMVVVVIMLIANSFKGSGGIE